MRDRQGRLAADVNAFLRADDTTTTTAVPIPMFTATPVISKRPKKPAGRSKAVAIKKAKDLTKTSKAREFNKTGKGTVKRNVKPKGKTARKKKEKTKKVDLMKKVSSNFSRLIRFLTKLICKQLHTYNSTIDIPLSDMLLERSSFYLINSCNFILRERDFQIHV